MFSVDLDDDNRIRSTYKANIYDMPFGMFVGLNNHFLSVIYVGVLLTKETAESFSWAFREFVSMMGGKPPVTHRLLLYLHCLFSRCLCHAVLQ